MRPSLHSFLFMDLVGFTALTAEHGDDRAADVAGHLFGRVRPLLAAHGGEEIKTVGDAMMVRCADPALAVALGVRIVAAVQATPGMPPLRVGVHTGTAVERGGDWYGGTVNVAARLCSAAAGGEVLVSDATCVAAGELGAIELGPQRLHWLKNVPEPIAARSAAAPEVRRERQPRSRRASWRPCVAQARVRRRLGGTGGLRHVPEGAA